MEVTAVVLGPFREGNGSFSLEPPRGFEPRTYALRVRCSTPELRRRSL